MKKVLLSAMNIRHWKQDEKSFVISMMVMGISNLFIVSFMLYHN